MHRVTMAARTAARRRLTVWWCAAAAVVAEYRADTSATLADDPNPSACCFSAADSPCATLSLDECEYHKFARCYVANDTWGVPRCTDGCGQPHCDPCCATQTCPDFEWSCRFCECMSNPETPSGCCNLDEHCVYSHAVPLKNSSLFVANGTCCPPNKGGANCDQCARGHFGADCSELCPTANGRICNGFGRCSDGSSGDGECTCETGHLPPLCTAVDPRMYNCSSVGGKACSGHGQCTSMLPPQVSVFRRRGCN